MFRRSLEVAGFNTFNIHETAFTDEVALVVKLYLWKCPIAGSNRIRQLTNGASSR